MFSSAFKSFTSNITSNYEISKQSAATAGPWTIFDAKKKSTNAKASIFVFKRETLDVSDGLGARASATSTRKVQDEVINRLKKEASSLARLRHPSILQLVEPVEDTKSGGLMFATEPVQCSLAAALVQKDRGQSRSDGEDSSSRALRDVELDTLEIQKGLLQVAKGLEFLHDSAKLVHGNLTPDAIFINEKSDWKISGLGFSGPPDGAEGHQSTTQISLSEALHLDQRIPRFVQLNLDYTSPDFVLDSSITSSADVFSLGLILLACYRSPHRSPIEAHGSQSTYKTICGSASSLPNPSNNYLCVNDLPQELAQTLPRVLARRPAQRMSASEFQQSEYFDNILVNTMRFMDALPAKTPAEKIQFMRGLGRVMPQFPKSILSKKVLTALLDEMKDRELLALILENVFAIVIAVPNSKEIVSERFLPQLRETFLSKSKTDEGDKSKEAGLLVVLENIKLVADNCTARQFKDDMLPIVHVAMESSTHSLTDAALQSIPVVLPLIDFSTVKHDLFPVVASVFSRTSSLSIKVRGLDALGILCGASSAGQTNDDLSGAIEADKPDKNISSLDKFTMQEKVVPLLKAIKTKEPAVMMAALKVFRQVGAVADIDFLAMEVMPVLWSFSLGPLLDLTQFRAFMDVIKTLSSKIEREQMKKLQELGSSRALESRTSSAMHIPVSNGASRASESTGNEDDFKKLVLGNKGENKNDPFAGAMSDGQRLTQNPASFSWQNANSSGIGQAQRSVAQIPALQPQAPSRSITPDVLSSAFPSLQPTASFSASVWGSTPSQPLQPQSRPLQSPPIQSPNYSSHFSIPPPPGQSQPINTFPRNNSSNVAPVLAPLPSSNAASMWQQPNYNIGSKSTNALGASLSTAQGQNNPAILRPQSQQQQRSGLDKYQSLL